MLKELKINKLPILEIDGINVGSFIRDTLRVDKNLSPEEAVVEIYKVLRPGEPPNLETAFEVFNSLFFKYGGLFWPAFFFPPCTGFAA